MNANKPSGTTASHNMAARQFGDSSARFSRNSSSLDVPLHIRGAPSFTLNKGLIAKKSAKIAQILKEHPCRDLSSLLKDIPIDPEGFELVIRFCHGLDLNLTPENIVSLSCIAHFLGMTENHCPNNLLKRAETYFEHKILPSWNGTMKALKSSERVLQQAARIGLVDACIEALVTKAIANPHLIGEPLQDLVFDDEGEREKVHASNVRKRLFDVDQNRSEDLTILSIQLYEPIILEMIQRLVPLEHIAGSLCRYAKKWIFSSHNREDKSSLCEPTTQREIVEAIERLLPEDTTSLVPCTFLSEMLRSAMVLEANSDCKTGLEIRIGKQLENATVRDLLIPSQGYAKESEYDMECVRRIMKSFYCNYKRSDILGLISVAELMDSFLAEVASDVDLNPTTFVSLAEMSSSASMDTQRNSDGIYRAIDTYLANHTYLTESEREEVCRVLDCNKMSTKACAHAAQNERLPLRVVVQILFVGQLHLRDTVVNCEKEGDEQGSGCEGEMRVEMEKMGSKVMELEKECVMMRREIESKGNKKGKVSVWKEMKRKLGCYNANKEEEFNCHAKKKKVHPRQ